MKKKAFSIQIKTFFSLAYFSRKFENEPWKSRKAWFGSFQSELAQTFWKERNVPLSVNSAPRTEAESEWRKWWMAAVSHPAWKERVLQRITSSNHSWGNCSYSALTAHSQHDTLPGQGQFSHLFCLWVDFIALVTPCCFHHLCSSYLPFTGNQTKIPKQRKILNSQII